MNMIVKVNQGSNRRNLRFTNTEIVPVRIQSHCAQAAPERMLKPAARPLPPTRCIHPQVLALVAIQSFALSMYEVSLTMPARPCSIQSAPPMKGRTPAKTAPPVLPYADVLAHDSCSLLLQNRLATLTAVASAILAPVLVISGRTPSRRL
jgi:hypothetical protein